MPDCLHISVGFCNLPTMLGAWIQWKARCAIDLCSRDSQQRLESFALSRFRHFLRAYSAGLTASPHDKPWHLFESHVTVKNTREGKRYKDWLFARVSGSKDNALDVIQGGASLIMRDVTRDYLRRETSPHHVTSLDQPVFSADGSWTTLLDLLSSEADPITEVARREYEELAARHADQFAANLSHRERTVILAKHLGVSLAHGTVEALAGCKKSVLNTVYNELIRRIACRLREQYGPDEPAESLLSLTLLTVHRLSELIFTKETSEKTFSDLFILIGGEQRGNSADS